MKHTTTLQLSPLALTAATALAVSNACGGPVVQTGTRVAVQINPSAIDDLGRATGRSVNDITAPPSAFDNWRSATRATADWTAVSSVANQSTEPPVVRQTAQTLDYYIQGPANEIARDAALDVACSSLLTGKNPTTDDANTALVKAGVNQVSPYGLQVYYAANELVDNWETVIRSGNEQNQVSVFVICTVATAPRPSR
jgi:hypothetical protein